MQKLIDRYKLPTAEFPGGDPEDPRELCPPSLRLAWVNEAEDDARYQRDMREINEYCRQIRR